MIGTAGGAIAIGNYAGSVSQSDGSIAIGQGAGAYGQGLTGGTGCAIAIGYQAGIYNQGDNAIAIGSGAGGTLDGLSTSNPGGTGQGESAIAIGYLAGCSGQCANAVAIGTLAGCTGQSPGSISIGYQAGQSDQSGSSIAIGYKAGQESQCNNSIAIGCGAGQYSQAVGTECSVAIGLKAGCTGQGGYAIAIGASAGASNQHDGTIILSGQVSGVNSTQAKSFYVAPVRVLSKNLDQNDGGLQWNAATGEIYSNTTKSFIIDHPLDTANKLLVHACLEGPEAGVYYRGKGEIMNGMSALIRLPSYVGQLCNRSDDYTVQITHIYDGKVKVFSASEVNVENNTFSVYGENGRFNWLVHGKRGNIIVERDKHNTTVKGDGPYKYI